MNVQMIMQTLALFAFGVLVIRATGARIRIATAQRAKAKRLQRQRKKVDHKAGANKGTKAATKPRDQVPAVVLRDALIAGTQLT